MISGCKTNLSVTHALCGLAAVSAAPKGRVLACMRLAELAAITSKQYFRQGGTHRRAGSTFGSTPKESFQCAQLLLQVTSTTGARPSTSRPHSSNTYMIKRGQACR